MRQRITKEEAIILVANNDGNTFDPKPHCIDSSWDFEDLYSYLERLEKSDDNDYPLVLSDIQVHIESCGFDTELFNQVWGALFPAEELVVVMY